MNEKFITKLETKNFLIGSFDAYLTLSKALMQKNSKLSLEEVEDRVNAMPTTSRAAIVNKDGKYIGYIGLWKVDAKNNISSIQFESTQILKQEDKTEILNAFKDYIKESLNIQNIDECIYKTKDFIETEKSEIIPKSNIIIPNKYLIPGITEEIIEKFSKDYIIPKLQLPFTIKSSTKVIGLIGLSNVIWSNKRANLNIFLDKSLGSDISNELSGYIINDYMNYVHQSNIHNITLSVNSSNQDMVSILNNTNMNYYGLIPFSSINDKYIESTLMFQHIPNMKNENRIIIPENKSIPLKLLDTEKKELAQFIELKNGYKLVSPKAFEKQNIKFDKILESHIKAMQNREKFAIPLGEDKYILQKGNEKYGIIKAMMNYSYVILNQDNLYAGYINILRNNANGKNAEIEIGIDPSMQHQGLGTIVIDRFYQELFSVGYASITSVVFSFNHPSLKFHEKIAELNGIRIDAYYTNGKLWNMNFYSQTNSLIKDKQLVKHI